jgi:subtilisin-like proprotein convertase family protein
MRWRPLAWLLLSALCFAAAYYFWRLGDEWAAQAGKSEGRNPKAESRDTGHPRQHVPRAPIRLLSGGGTLNIPPASSPPTNQASRVAGALALRLSNTAKPLKVLQRSDRAILLENALLDTTQPGPSIPDHLRAQGDPGSYVVQARGLIDAGFRSLLTAAGASVVAYIPNNAYLVRASEAVAEQLQGDPRTQSVLPYEPYYKLKPSLLKLAVPQQPLPDGSVLNVLLFADARDQTLAALGDLGAKVLGQDQSPFGPVVQVVPPVESLPLLAGLPGVQELELAAARVPANDLSRVAIGVATDTLTSSNYLGLTGTNVLVNVNDSGVDATHPDLSLRVFANSTNALVDPNGHGTHVAGIIASSGASSTSPVNVGALASGSVSNASFRGKAPAAKLFVQPLGMMTKPFTDGATLTWPSDSGLQQGAAQTNAFISNNGWNYVGVDSQTYDLHAASYDAAVRDALPTVSGSQPLLLVFPAGNGGGGDDNGGTGNPDTVESPATAKNVITVGAIEQPRYITNQTWICSMVNGTNSCLTNQPWLAMTDSSNQVASFSSRGNVGIGVEGQFGRFKPDVVAPGTFVVSTKSAQWDTNAYYNPTGNIYFPYPGVILASNELYYGSIFVPDNAVQVNLAAVPNTNSPVPFPDLPIFVKLSDYPTNGPGGYDFVGTNEVSWPPDYPLTQVGTFWYFAVANYSTGAVDFDLVTDIVVTNELGNYLQVLAGMNDALGPYYRYESGTSMAAADASGQLALMQEFFESRLKLTSHSPALFKAMLINGARPVSGVYDFNVQAAVNFQGWGLINLPTSLPGSLTNVAGATNSIIIIDQDPTNALATGQSHTRRVSLSPAARNQPLRITLVWTDPPGDPIVSVKLVNDLNLVVTNLDTSEVFYGNDIEAGSDFNTPWATNTVPNVDSVNNVENVYLTPSLESNGVLGTNYSVTVVGYRVNVNAVTANPNNVVQDYALVISSGDGQPENTLTLVDSPTVYQTEPLVTVIPNMFTNSPGFVGGFLFNQRVGANTPLLGTNTVLLPTEADGVLTLGMTNQWHFYALTNNTSYTNAAFLTFLPANLSVPRMGVFEPTADQAVRPEADIDLYVAPPTIPNNYALTNLDPAVVEAADKSLSRGGTETIVYSNATPGVYYIGVKSEDQQAAEYAFLGVLSQLPFGNTDTNGNQTLFGFPVPMPIPDGSPSQPGVAQVMAVSVQPITLHRVIVTNVIAHQLMTDLIGSLSHAGQYAILNNHTCVTDPTTANCETWTSYIYDDSAERNVGPNPFLINPWVQHTDGPGTLNNFANQNGVGQWLLTMVDNQTNHIGTNVALSLFLERQPNLSGVGGIIVTLQGGACRNDFVEVPAQATSMTVSIGILQASLPIDVTLEVCPSSGGACKSVVITNTLGGSVTIDQTDLPPLQPGGSYTVRTCNLANSPITVNIRAIFSLSFTTVMPVVTAQTTAPTPITNDAVTDIYLTNNTHEIISSLDVGLLLTDPQVSDLAITLISPNGTRVLLFENRGGLTTNGLGIGTFGISVVTNMEPLYTNNFDLAPVGLYSPGAMFQGWSVLSNQVDVLDDYTCFCLSNHVLGLLDGGVSNSLPTTNAVSASALNPYTLTYRVNHLPWLEGMVTWWPLDADASDIFGGLNGLLYGDVVFSTGATNSFFDDFGGPGLNPIWQAALPSASTGAGAAPIETYVGAPSYTFGSLGTNTILRLSNTLNPQQRCGWSSATVFNGQDFRYEVRFNTLNQGAGISTGGFLELWILDAANTNRYDLVSVFSGTNSSASALLAGSSIDNSYYTLPFGFQTNTWYRLVLTAPPDQGVQAAVLSDSGMELTGVSFSHGATAFGSGFRIVLAQFVGASAAAAPVDVAVDYARLMSGQSGEVNQAFFGDGLATRMIVPRCPELDLGRARGFSIEGWINPANVASAAPLVEWYDSTATTTQSSRGVQFWLGLTNGPGSLTANFWDTNSQPHTIATVPLALTNGGWQHVALTYDTNSGNAVLYTNGQSAATVQFPTRFMPRTSGDLYLGYDPAIVPALVNYSNFSSIAGLNLTGSAAQMGTFVRLTPAAEQVYGNVWAKTKQPCAAGFETTYQCRWSNLGNGGGDEIWFTVQNDSPTSAAAYGNYCSGTNFVSIFLDCRAFPPYGDNGNSIAIVTNNYNVGQQTDLTSKGITLKDGEVHTVRAIYDGQAFNVWLDNIQVITNVLVPGLKMATDVNGYGWVGLGALCGLAYSAQDVLSWTFGGPTPGSAFAGGLDEFSVYQRALSPCEVNAIYNAGSRGKYGTNVLVCPVATEVTLLTASGSQTYAFTNGLTWTNNGPQWETNTISFSTSNNPMAIVVSGLNPYNPGDANSANNLNAMVDDFVLAGLVTNTINGLLHFTDDTNRATLPIKFAPTPYVASNFPPVLVFTNGFGSAPAGLYNAGGTIPGTFNGAAIGTRDWTVNQGSVTVISNALLDAVATNCLAMATGSVQCLLPTIPGHRYQLSYNLRGPCAVGWWDGSVDPLSQRAQDLISGNNGAFLNGATNVTPGFVGAQGFFFNGQTEPPAAQDPDIWLEDTDDPASKIELGDPPQLQFTNAFTIEGWINPLLITNAVGDGTNCGTEQIFFRGYPEPFDCGGLGDPYWLALEPSADATRYNLHFHIADAQTGTTGADVLTTNGPVQLGGGSNGGWWHIAAVFDKPFTSATVVSNGTTIGTVTTNALRLYLNGVCVATNYTTLSPYQTLDPALNPGVTIGSRSRYDWTQPFFGFMDEVTVYARALTGPEIAAIAGTGSNGKSVYSLPAAQSLAALNVSVDGDSLGVAYGDNSQWSTQSVQFTAVETSAVVVLQSLVPGTLVDGIALTEIASELAYLPEVPLSDLYGEDAYGVWTLEIQDDYAGETITNAQLLEWQLNFGLSPSNPPPIISLSHGIPYTNSLPANSIQYFNVQVPQWATRATNILEFAVQAHTNNELPVTVFFNQTNYPSPSDLALIGPQVSSGTVVLATNSIPALVPGQTCYLALSNPNSLPVTFALGVWFDITTLGNCQMTTSAVGPAGIPRYFQFDVTNRSSASLPPQAVSVWLSGANSNLTLVMSEHLPLPDLDHYDYISQQPGTNQEIVMLVTNTTPFPIQTNRWYVGVFNTTATNVAFSIQACLRTAYPVIIPLTNGIPFVVASGTSAFAAPPGPPQQFFFDFVISNSVPGVLFELYNLSGDADLVLQQDVPPTMAPYFDGSFEPGTTPEQIVLRTNSTLTDLRGLWYLGVYNNESFNVAYTIRAVLPDDNGLLVSAQPLQMALTLLTPPNGLLLSWNSVEGEHYFVQYTASIAAPVTWTNIGFVTATTPLTTFEVLPVPAAPAFFRIVQVFSSRPTLFLQAWPPNQVRLWWSTAYPGYTLQSEVGLSGTWANAGLAVTVVGNEYVAFDNVGPVTKYYRLVK